MWKKPLLMQIPFMHSNVIRYVFFLHYNVLIRQNTTVFKMWEKHRNSIFSVKLIFLFYSAHLFLCHPLCYLLFLSSPSASFIVLDKKMIKKKNGSAFANRLKFSLMVHVDRQAIM